MQTTPLKILGPDAVRIRAGMTKPEAYFTRTSGTTENPGRSL